MQTVEEAYKFLREQNLGVMPDGRTFGEVMDHFVTGGDETCLLSHLYVFSRGRVVYTDRGDTPKPGNMNT